MRRTGDIAAQAGRIAPLAATVQDIARALASELAMTWAATFFFGQKPRDGRSRAGSGIWV